MNAVDTKRETHWAYNLLMGSPGSIYIPGKKSWEIKRTVTKPSNRPQAGLEAFGNHLSE
jgi:hypothetical protein